MEVLAKGFNADVEVIKVEENFDTYSGQSGQMYCHKTTFRLDDGSEYLGQLCSELNNCGYSAGDIINLTIKNYSKNLHSFQVNRIDKIIKTVAKSEVPQQSTRSSTIMLTGTPGELSLRYAVQYHANRIDASPESILETAEKFKEYLRNNTI